MDRLLQCQTKQRERSPLAAGRCALGAIVCITAIVSVTSADDAPTPAATLSGHADTVYAVTFSSDGNWIVTGSFDKTVRVWDAATLETVHTLEGSGGIVLDVALSPDSTRIASCALENNIRLWDRTEGKPLAELAGHGGHVYGLAFSPDGTILASASNDKTVRFWSMAENKELKTLTTQAAAVYDLAFSPDGKSLLIAGADKTVRLLSAEDGSEVRQYQGPEDAIYTACFHPDGSRIAAGGVGLGESRRLFVWNVDNPQPAHVLTGHTDDVYRVQFHPAENRLLSVGYSGIVKEWNLDSGQAEFSIDLPVILYSGAYSPDAKRIAVAANDNKVYLFDRPPAAE